MKKIIFTLFVFTALAACSDVADTVIPSDMATWDKELAPKLQELSDADRERVAAYLTRVKMGELFGGNGVPPGTTIGQALEEQREWEAKWEAQRAEGAALRAKLETERTAALKELGNAVTVTLLGKREWPENYDIGRYGEYQEFRIGVQNNSKKEIAGVSGLIEFIDIFDKKVGSVGFAISETIAPGESITWTGGRDYNQFVDEHRAVWNLEEGKYNTLFVPEMVVFQDGTKLSVPE